MKQFLRMSWWRKNSRSLCKSWLTRDSQVGTRTRNHQVFIREGFLFHEFQDFLLFLFLFQQVWEGEVLKVPCCPLSCRQEAFYGSTGILGISMEWGTVWWRFFVQVPCPLPPPPTCVVRTFWAPFLHLGDLPRLRHFRQWVKCCRKVLWNWWIIQVWVTTFSCFSCKRWSTFWVWTSSRWRWRLSLWCWG